jgi:SAM-dependent methyltransferase
MTDPTQRFTNRVDPYVRHRPSYPRAVLDLLEKRCALTSAPVVADVGSGTGIPSELFLENGNRLLGIEPNREMREAAERRLGRHPCFTSVAGAAEATTLDDAAVDFVTAGQAFHWLDTEQARGSSLAPSNPKAGSCSLEPAAQRHHAVPRGLRATARGLQDGPR